LKLSSEDLFLQNLLRGSPPEDLEQIDQVALFRLFRRHRLLPLAGEITHHLGKDKREGWEKAIQTVNIRSLVQLSSLSQIILSFSQEGIKAIPLKGPVLAHQLYGDVNQRYSRDLDLLVDAEEIYRAIDIARDLGYEPAVPNRTLSEKEWTHYFRYQYDVGLYNSEQGIFLELHTRLLYPDMFTIEEEQLLTTHLRNTSFGGLDLKTMDPESTLLYLVIHGAHHLYFRLFWLRDVAEAMRRWELDHAEILLKAKKLRIERVLGVTLQLVQRFFGFTIPDVYGGFLEKENRVLVSMEKRCIRAIHGPATPTLKGRVHRLLFFLELRPGLRHRLVTMSNVFQRWRIRHLINR